MAQMDVHAIIGGTGFIGRYLTGEILKGDGEVRVRLLSRSHPKFLPSGTEFFPVDIATGKGLQEGLKGATVVWYLPGILAETREQSYESVHHQGVVHTIGSLDRQSTRRLVLVSAVGTAINAPSAYHRTKAKAEEAVMKSGLPFTIVRPSLVFGEGDRSINQFLEFGKNLHILPMIGPGISRVQPIFAGDLAKFLVLAAQKEESQGKTYETGGPRIYTYREMMEAIKRSRHLSAIIMGAPVGVMMASAVMQRLLLKSPLITPDVVRMALSDNVPLKNACVADFGMTLLGLEAWLEKSAH